LNFKEGDVKKARTAFLGLLILLPFAAVAAGDEEVKLPPGTKLPPMPHEWMAPSVDMTPPSAVARWGGDWKRGRPLPLPLAAHGAVFQSPYLYIVGGVTGRDGLGQRDVWMSRIAKGGELGTWKKTKPMAVPVAFAGVVPAAGRIYVLGGASRDGLQLIYDTVYSAPMKKDGGLGAWREERRLPVKMMYHAAVAHDGFLYVLGGFDGQEYRQTLYYSKLEPGGGLGEWSAAKVFYPHRVGRTYMTVSGGDLIVVGGMWSDSQGEHVSSLVMRGKRTPEGDVVSWGDDDRIKVAARPLRFSLADEAGANDGDFIYAFGGRDPGSPGIPTTQACWVNPVKDKLTRWQFGPDLPLFGAKGAPQKARVFQSAAVIADDHALVLGGFLFIREVTPEVWVMPLKKYEEPDWLKAAKKR
jgi:hypothetical protein